MSRNEIMYLMDMTESCEKVLRFTHGLTQAEFTADEKTYDAVVRNLEIVGEAAKQVSQEVRTKLPQVEWRKIAGLRDMLAHAYFGIDNVILWDVVQNKVPELLTLLNNFLDKERD